MKRELSPLTKIENSIWRDYRESLWNPFTNALKSYDLISEGDRIAVCVSGGKDSMLMAKLMDLLHRHSKFPFEVVYLVMDPGYRNEEITRISDNAKRLGLDITIFKTNVFSDAVHANEKSPCYMCARMRRGYLYSEASYLGCNKIALGHHYDDVIETTLMGMLYGSKLEAMPPKLCSTNHPGMQLIRPLYLVKEENIISWADFNGLEFITGACSVTKSGEGCGGSMRQKTKELIGTLSHDNPAVKSSIFNSIHNVELDTMVGYKKLGVRYSFEDVFAERKSYREKDLPET
ncbi:MAG: tRNA 2-thiocytidine biosynthesis protein TtcA [Firmicutes bacterium]|nr:tRNA 2-thiocytidine biosynthesis protein TtcA [Bacillota bacterium]